MVEAQRCGRALSRGRVGVRERVTGEEVKQCSQEIPNQARGTYRVASALEISNVDLGGGRLGVDRLLGHCQSRSSIFVQLYKRLQYRHA